MSIESGNLCGLDVYEIYYNLQSLCNRGVKVGFLWIRAHVHVDEESGH